VNPIDVALRAGHLAQFLPLAFPAIPGRDAVGVVDEVGPGVTDTQVGDTVFGLGGVSDTTAEFAVLTAWSAVPEIWSTAQVSGFAVALLLRRRNRPESARCIGEKHWPADFCEPRSQGPGDDVRPPALDRDGGD
jgi:hypothetical protein